VAAPADRIPATYWPTFAIKLITTERAATGTPPLYDVKFREGRHAVPKSRREAGFLALAGLALAIFGAAADIEYKGAAVIIGAVAFLIGAVLWLIHYSADLRKQPSDD